MKTGVIALLISLFTVCIIAQSAILPSPSLSTGIPTSLGMALGKGDVEAITGFFDQQVELTLPQMTTAEKVTKNEARDLLMQFYESFSPRGYHILSVVDNARESGELVTLKGSFKVQIAYDEVRTKRLVGALSITPVGDVSLQ
jgi:hypothetical protein